MRKVGITGHTSGIGKEIYEYCMFKGYEVYGYSRATGFNMAERDADHIINDIPYIYHLFKILLTVLIISELEISFIQY